VDLALVHVESDRISVLLNRGNGTFRHRVRYPCGNGQWALVVADVNGDGREDLATTSSVSNSVSVLLGHGDGTFAPAVQSFVSAANYPNAQDLVASDFDRDGRMDVAVTIPQGGQVSLLRGRGDGSFEPGVSYETGRKPVRVVAGDFNGDGFFDVATTNLGSTAVTIVPGQGNGTFRPAVHYPVYDRPVWLAVGDFNGDGGSDLAVTVHVPTDAVPPAGLNILLGRVIVTVTVNTVPPGLAFTVDGMTYTAPQTFQWLSGTEHVIQTVSTQSGGAGTRFVFDNWSDGGGLSHVVAGPSFPTTYTATFRTQYRLTTTASPATGGTVSVTPVSRDSYYDSGTVLQLTAAPNRGYPFANWTGSVSGTTNPRAVIMQGPMSITANFSIPFSLR
jgi:hypothetical protein